MAKPMLVSDLRSTLNNMYSEEQLKELDEALIGIGIDMERSSHLEVIREIDLRYTVEELALEMSGLAVMPWYFELNYGAIIHSCFSKIIIFGDVYYMFASTVRPAVREVRITPNGVETGGVMAG